MVWDTGTITPSLLVDTFKLVNNLTVYREHVVLLGIDSGDHALVYHGQPHVFTNKPGGVILVLGQLLHSAPGSR